MSVTYRELCTSVATTLRAGDIFKLVQNFDELTEDVPTTPLGRVYPDDGNTDFGGETDRTSFQVGIRATSMTITIECYARARSQLKHDIAAQIDLLDAVDAVINEQVDQPFFGNPAIKAFSWSWERVTFQHNKIDYPGIEIKLTLIVF